MTSLLEITTVTLGTFLVALAVAIVVVRAVGDARRARERRVRPRFESALADYLTGPDRRRPERPTRSERELFLRVVLDMLAEVRGADQERLTALLERMGFVDDLVGRLARRRRSARRCAAVTLVTVASTSARQPLVAALDDPDAEVRISCAAALVTIGADETLPRIVEVAAAALDDHSYPATDLMLAAGRRNPLVLIEAFRVGPPAVRRRVAELLGVLRVADAAGDLREALTSADEELVAVAARSLGLIGDSEALPALCALVGDGHRPEFVRVAAVRAIGAIGDLQAGPVVVRALDSDLWYLHSAAADTLTLLGWPERTATPGSLDPPARARALSGPES